MPEPGLTSLHTDQRLTDFAVSYAQDPQAFVARQVFPVQPVGKRSDKYVVFTKDDARRSDAKLRAAGTESALRGFTVSDVTYYCNRWSIAADITEEDEATADEIFDLEEDYTALTVDDLRIQEDVQWAADHFTTSVWGTDKTGGTDFTKWSDPSATPIEDIAEAVRVILQNTGQMANTMVLGANVWYGTGLGSPGLMHHPDIIARLPDNAPRIVTQAFLANLFDMDNVYIATGSYNSAEEGLSGSDSFLLGGHALVCRVVRGSSRRIATAGRTFLWTGLQGSAEGFRTKNYPIEERSVVARIETDTAYDHKVVASDLGYFFSTAV